MNYHIKIKAQVEWETWIEADSSEQAEREAREDFDSSQSTNSTDVEIINSVKVLELPEGHPLLDQSPTLAQMLRDAIRKDLNLLHGKNSEGDSLSSTRNDGQCGL